MANDQMYPEWQEKVRGTNINDQTLLATDYLNHFNEIIMTLEMIPDMPELMEEAAAWQPKSYQDHFRGCSFSDAALAVAAYDHVPGEFREPFETTITQMDHLLAATIERLQRDLEAGDIGLARTTVSAASLLLQRLLDHASGIIHGSVKTMDQAEIDSILGK